MASDQAEEALLGLLNEEPFLPPNRPRVEQYADLQMQLGNKTARDDYEFGTVRGALRQAGDRLVLGPPSLGGFVGHGTVTVHAPADPASPAPWGAEEQVLRFHGEMKGGLLDGMGKLVESDANPKVVYVGGFRNDEKHGRGQVIVDGVSRAVEFEDGVEVPPREEEAGSVESDATALSPAAAFEAKRARHLERLKEVKGILENRGNLTEDCVVTLHDDLHLPNVWTKPYLVVDKRGSQSLVMLSESHPEMLMDIGMLTATAAALVSLPHQDGWPTFHRHQATVSKVLACDYDFVDKQDIAASKFIQSSRVWRVGTPYRHRDWNKAAAAKRERPDGALAEVEEFQRLARNALCEQGARRAQFSEEMDERDDSSDSSVSDP